MTAMPQPERRPTVGSPVAGFKAWWPDDGETVEDAVAIELPPGWLSWEAERHRLAAEEAAEYDHGERDGWERESDEQEIMVLAVDAEDRPLGPAQKFVVTREVVPQWSATREETDAQA